MANQPTKYRKFVVGAASAALVASAVAPVAFAAEFTDVKDNNSHKAAIDALSDAGVISGYPDGTFQPNKTLSRSDVVKLMGKWLIAEGYDVPTDYKTKPRFADLKTTSNDELLKMSALVYDNGLFVGKPDGTLDPAGDITRENMAIVLVRAFDRVYDVDLVSYVKAQDFNKDVTDLGKAKAEARPAIDVLDFFDITNPAAPEFNPKNTTTRGQFASFLYKTTKVDFDKIGGEVVAPGVASVKAVNATTVEVKMDAKVENIDSLKFTIDGLTVSNAAVKQSDDKTVVLTTAVQKGAEKYTVKLNDKAIGNFTGISNVVPAKISLNTKSVQGIVGQQAILSADIGVKEAGVPVTFNVKANTTGTLNKDQVFEAVTNADGIATFSYTQYNAGDDTVTVYPTGNAALREQGMVYWSNTAQLSIKDITEATTLANGAKKVYEINSARNAGGYVFVTFKENLNVTPDKLVKTVTAEGVTTHALDAITGKPGAALASGAYPYKASTSGENVVAVKLDASGKANLVLTGSNATATPIVYEGSGVTLGESNAALYNAKYTATARQATATAVTFEVKQSLGLTIKAEGVQNAATYKNATQTGGRDYALTFNTTDGKPATPGTKVNVLIDMENVTGTLHVLDEDNKEVTAFTSYENNKKRVYTVEVGKDGKAMFTVSSDKENDFVTPVAFIDNGKTTGQLDADDLQATGEITYFVEKVTYTAKLKAVDKNNKPVSTVIANGAEAATFVYQLVDQNGKPRSSTDATTVSFEVQAGTGNIVAGGTPITAGTTKTVPVVIAGGQTQGTLDVVAATPSTATVTATGSKAGVVLPTTTPTSVSVSFSQYGSAAVTGPVSNLNTDLEVLTVNNTVYNYANAAAYQIKGSAVTKTAFENEIAAGNKNVSVTVGSDGKFTFNVLDATPGTGTTTGVVDQLKNATTPAAKKAILKTAYPELSDLQVDALLVPVTAKVDSGTINASNLQSDYDTLFLNVKSAKAIDSDNDGIADQIAITFTNAVTAAEKTALDTNVARFVIDNGTAIAAGSALATENTANDTLVFTVNGATNADLGKLTVTESVSADINTAVTPQWLVGSVTTIAPSLQTTGVTSTVAGHADGNNGTKAAQTLTFETTAGGTGNAVNTGTAVVTVKGSGFNAGNAVSVNVPVTIGDTPTVQATSAVTALNANPTVSAFYTASSVANVVTLTEKTARAIVNSAANGAVSVAGGTNNVITGVAPLVGGNITTNGVAAIGDVDTITITGPAINAGTVSVTVKQGAIDKTVSVSVNAAETAIQITNKLYNALSSDTTINAAYTVTLTAGNTITLTNKTTGDTANAVITVK